MEIKMCVPLEFTRTISPIITNVYTTYLPRFMVQDSNTITIYDIIKPLYYLSRLVCLWPYRYQKENEITPLTTKDKLIAFIFLVTISVSMVWHLSIKLEINSQAFSYMAVVIEVIYILFIHILAVISIILANSNFGQFTKKFFIELESLSKLQIISTDMIYFKLRRNLTLQMLAAIFLTLCLTALDILLLIHYLDVSHTSYYISTYIVQYLLIIIFFQIYSKVEILLLYFQSLNEKFANSALSTPQHITDLSSALTNFKCEQVKLFRLLHGKLCNLIHINNDAHGWQIVILIFSVSALVLNSAYPCLTATLQEHGTSLNGMETLLSIRQIVYISFYCILIIMLAGKCSATRKQAFKTGLLAHEILLDLPIEDGNRSTQMYKEQLQLLIEQISYRNPHFSAGGMFSVDYTAVAVTANLITSNAIVLLQLGKYKDSGEMRKTGTATALGGNEMERNRELGLVRSYAVELELVGLIRCGRSLLVRRLTDPNPCICQAVIDLPNIVFKS